jgi:DNA-binding MarR family transcriptional regulator
MAVDKVALLVADIFESAGLFRRQGEIIATALGQTQARWGVMSGAHDEVRTVPQIARRQGMSRQSIQRTANELVKDGLAEFQTNPDHRSSPVLVLTPKGTKIHEDIMQKARKYHQHSLEVVSEEEIDKICEGLQRINSRLRQTLQQGKTTA